MRKSIPKHRRQRSLGEFISTLCFLGTAGYLLLVGLEHLDAGEAMRGYLILLAGFCCFLGALRFKIASMWDTMRGNDE